MIAGRTRTTAATLTLAAALATAVGACTDDDGASETSPASDATTSTTALAMGPGTPEEAAQCLFDAWAAGAIAAVDCADEIAVDELFAHSSDGASDMEFAGCTGEDVSYRCSWRYEGGALHMIVVDSEIGGWRVSDIEYAVD